MGETWREIAFSGGVVLLNLAIVLAIVVGLSRIVAGLGARPTLIAAGWCALIGAALLAAGIIPA